MPIPHNGPRASPVTDLRNDETPAVKIAADTMLPSGILTSTPSTTTTTSSGMTQLRYARRKVRANWNCRAPVHDLIYQQFRSSKRSRDTQTFMPRCEIESVVQDVGSNQWQLVRRSCPKSSPGAYG